MRILLLMFAIGATGWVAVRTPPHAQTQELPPTGVEERRAWLRERIADNPALRAHANPDCPGSCHGDRCFVHFDPRWIGSGE